MIPGLSTIEAVGAELTSISADAVRLSKRIDRARETALSAAAELAKASSRVSSPKAVASPVALTVGRSFRTSPVLTARVQDALNLSTKREAEAVIGSVVAALEETLAENLDRDGFSVKLGRFGKLTVHHKPGVFRKIPFTGESKMTKEKRKVRFVVLGRLRQLEKVSDDR